MARREAISERNASKRKVERRELIGPQLNSRIYAADEDENGRDEEDGGQSEANEDNSGDADVSGNNEMPGYYMTEVLNAATELASGTTVPKPRNATTNAAVAEKAKFLEDVANATTKYAFTDPAWKAWASDLCTLTTPANKTWYTDNKKMVTEKYKEMLTKLEPDVARAQHSYPRTHTQ